MRRLQSYTSLPANPAAAGLSATAKKLRLKPDHVVAVLDAPPGWLETLEPGPATVVTELKAGHLYDALLLFVQEADVLRAMRDVAVGAVKPDGLLWIAHRKGAWTGDLVADAFAGTGYAPVALVNLDEAWTAVRLKSG